ncbi:MAG: hypothetical protein CL583_12725 [Alteromonadaceae bacterium]|nr:hypothetical protein [Alteromonadaceae bacterium]|tara:strand:- start:2105 stop:2323 length:219 start_codon:yes stop_codon:yes gene_type:complete
MNDFQYDDTQNNLHALIATTLFAAALGFLLFRPRRQGLLLQQVDHRAEPSKLPVLISDQDFARMAPVSATLH